MVRFAAHAADSGNRRRPRLTAQRLRSREWPTYFALDNLASVEGDLRLIDTGPGELGQLRTILRRVDHVLVPVRLETMTLQALNKFLPVVD